MESSGDGGGAEENAEGSKCEEEQPEQEQTTDHQIPPAGAESKEALNRSENNSRPVDLSVESVDENGEEEIQEETGETQMTDNEPDSSLTLQELELSGGANSVKGQMISDIPLPTEEGRASDAKAEDHIEDASLLIKNVDETVKSIAMAGSSAAEESKKASDNGGQEGVDEELEHFFKSAQPDYGKFPGLDNVDLASDEDGHEGNMGIGREVTAEGTSPETGQDDQCCDEEFAPTIKESEEKTSPRKDYPLAPGQYEVCREVQPGVKQCLILETGEEEVCMTKPKMPAVSTSPPTFTNPFSSSSPRPAVSGKKSDDADKEDEMSPRTPSTVVNDTSDAFAYVSFEDGSELNSVKSQPFVLGENRQAFITKNGIPILLDDAENDLKLNLDEHLGKFAIPVDRHSPTVVDEAAEAGHVETETQENEPVADVLSSGGEGGNGIPHLNDSKPVKTSKRKRNKKQRFYDLQPDNQAENVGDDVEEEMGEGVNLNKSNNSSSSDFVSRHHDCEGDEVNSNNNAYEGERFSNRMAYNGSDAARNLRSHYEQNLSSRRFLASGVSGSESMSYSPSSRQTTSTDNSRHFTPGESSYSRYGDHRSPFDSSHLSTRYSHIDRGDPSSSANTQESLTIPRFRTLHDQQVSWLGMFKMIEDQHRNDLQSQYSEHQQILRDMQQKMERELIKQQDTLKHRLQSHKEILQELSPGRGGCSRRDLTYSQRHQQRPYDDTSHTTIDGTTVTLKYPPPLSDRLERAEEDHHHNKRESYNQVNFKRLQEKELSSSSRPVDASLNLSDVAEHKLLRGGVYSSPMPLTKARQKKPKSGRPYENRSHNSHGDKNAHTVISSYGSQAPNPNSEERTHDAVLTESDDMTSPRSRVSLREKHAKHVADLRAYYEEELKEMRAILLSRQTGEDPAYSRDSEGSLPVAGDTILTNENAELRHRCQELDDECHDLKIEIRELQQKIQGLDVRASDYAERYNNSQAQVRSLHARLEELTAFAKEKEATAGDLKSKNKCSDDALHVAFKKEKELADSLHAATTTIQRLVEKYEFLEKDQQLLKESMADKDDKLFASRKEVMDANNKLSRMELDNKQLLHEKDVLKHELTMARSSVSSMHTCFDEAYKGGSSAPSMTSKQSRDTVNGLRSRSGERSQSQRSLSRDRNLVQTEQASPNSETDGEYSNSPIIKAERELKKLRESVGSSQEFAPKLQRKFYGTEASHGGSAGLRGSSSILSPGRNGKSKSSPETPKSSTSPRDKKGRSETINGIKGGISTHVNALTASQQSGKSLNRREHKTHTSADTPMQGTVKRVDFENGWKSEQVLERVKAGEVVSRPAWEDIYTSMAPTRSSATGSGDKRTANATRDQMIRERLQNIDLLERKYDDLSNEKRKFEAALSKVPGHGPRREKERLETELDRLDRDLGSVRMSLKRFHVLKSTI